MKELIALAIGAGVALYVNGKVSEIRVLKEENEVLKAKLKAREESDK